MSVWTAPYGSQIPRIALLQNPGPTPAESTARLTPVWWSQNSQIFLHLQANLMHIHMNTMLRTASERNALFQLPCHCCSP